MKRKHAQHQREHQTLAAAVAELSSINDKCSSECTAVQSLRQDAQTVQRLTQQLKDLHKKIEPMESSLASHMTRRPLAEATAESSTLEQQRYYCFVVRSTCNNTVQERS